jgi:hypothetical protein
MEDEVQKYNILIAEDQ